MKILKWFLDHPLAAIWALGAIAILLSFGSGNKNQEVASDNHETKSDVVETEVSTAVKETITNKVSMENPLPVTNKNIQQEGLPQQVQESITAVEPAVTQAEQANPVNNATLKNSPEPFVSDATAETIKSNPSEKVAEDLGQLGTDELLLMAREAYWNNGLDEAAEIYQQLIKQEPQVIEHKGELGNVYWRQGYPKKAAELYSEIAIPLIESGSSGRVSNMLGFIQLFYPDRVEVIMDRLKRSNNNN